MPHPAVAAIVPAYNEEKTVGELVRTLVTSGVFHEVIVVSDGSTDGTVRTARDAGATLVHAFSSNRGKGAALAHGVTHTDAPVICFFDADLVGLTIAHVEVLLAPVVSGERFMSIGIRDRVAMTDLVARIFKIGGQRALRRDIFENLPPQCTSGYKIETALNYFCRVNGLAYDVVTLPALRFRRKIDKLGVLGGVRGYLKMSLQIVWAMLQVRLSHGEFVERGAHVKHRHRERRSDEVEKF